MCYISWRAWTVCEHHEHATTKCVDGERGGCLSRDLLDCLGWPKKNGCRKLLRVPGPVFLNGFCRACCGHYERLGYSVVGNKSAYLNYWRYKLDQGLDHPVPAIDVPAELIFTNALPKPFSQSDVSKQLVSFDKGLGEPWRTLLPGNTERFANLWQAKYANLIGAHSVNGFDEAIAPLYPLLTLGNLHEVVKELGLES